MLWLVSTRAGKAYHVFRLLHAAGLLLRHGKGEKIRCARVQPVDRLRGGGEGSQAGGTHQHRLLRRIPHAPQNLLPPVVKAEHVQVWRGEGGIPLCDAQKSMQRKPTDARMRIALGFHATEQGCRESRRSVCLHIAYIPALR